MNRLQFWILTVTSSLVAALYVFEIFLALWAADAQISFSRDENAVQAGRQYYEQWRALATRVYQASQTDPELRDILNREDIQIQEPSPHTAPESTTAAPLPAGGSH